MQNLENHHIMRLFFQRQLLSLNLLSLTDRFLSLYSPNMKKKKKNTTWWSSKSWAMAAECPLIFTAASDKNEFSIVRVCFKFKALIILMGKHFRSNILNLKLQDCLKDGALEVVTNVNGYRAKNWKIIAGITATGVNHVLCISYGLYTATWVWYIQESVFTVQHF